MAASIRWKIPASVSAVPNTAHTLKIYRSTNGEDGDYSEIASLSAGGGNTVKTYTDSGGETRYHYYVTYTPSGSSEGDRVLAVIALTVKEQRLAEQIQGKLPEIVKARIDSDLIDIKKAMGNALATVNAYSPQTSYTISSMPERLETVVVILGMVLLYLEHQLQVSIRDYSYSGTGISLQIDRNSKFASTLQSLTKALNELLAFSKHPDWPVEGMGLGSEALCTPGERVLSFLYR